MSAHTSPRADPRAEACSLAGRFAERSRTPLRSGCGDEIAEFTEIKVLESLEPDTRLPDRDPTEAWSPEVSEIPTVLLAKYVNAQRLRTEVASLAVTFC